MVNVIILSNTVDENIKNMTIQCINSLLNQNIEVDIIVVETNKMHLSYSNATVIHPNEDFNYNRFLNYAIDNIKIKGSHILISNNDVIYHDNCLLNLLKYDFDSQSPFENTCHTKLYTKRISKIGYNPRWHITGWSILLKWSVIDKIGLFDERFKFWYQDNDYGRTLKEHKLIHYLNSDAEVTHLAESNNETGLSHKSIKEDDYYNMTIGAEELFKQKWNDKIKYIPMERKQLNPVTFVLTSCGRVDLLQKTMESFLKYNTYPIAQYIIIDDSGDMSAHNKIKELYPDYTLILNEKRIGQIKSIDKAYKKVKTDWIFHCEDDWEFYKGGFIEASMNILKDNPQIIQVWLRELNDTNGHTYEYFDEELSVMDNDWNGWGGFSFNPGLKRLSDYNILKPYSKHTPENKKEFYTPEFEISQIYANMGYIACIFNNGFVKHIGWRRHIS